MSEKVRYKEVRGRLGFFGFVWRLLLVGWQFLMIFWFLDYTSSVAPLVDNSTSDAGSLGAAIGVGLSWSLILFFWVGGTIILGLFALLTRPAKAMVKEE